MKNTLRELVTAIDGGVTKPQDLAHHFGVSHERLVRVVSHLARWKVVASPVDAVNPIALVGTPEECFARLATQDIEGDVPIGPS